ncbi:MAG TPA: hypothetical protein VGH28_06665 [Polyangiaceae bacterium]
MEAEVSLPAKEEVDPELLQLPDPPRGERRSTLVLLAIAAVASAAMALSLTRDAAYALRATSATDLGDLGTAPSSTFVSNSYVEGHGRLGGAGQIRYERPFEGDSYRIAPVAGRPDVWVEFRVPAGAESNRFVPKTDFSGRLVRFADAGLRHRGLRSAIADRTGQRVPPDAYLLVDGQAPDGARAFAMLWLMFVAFALWNVATIVRLVRKVK